MDTLAAGPLGVVQLRALMDRTAGRPEIAIGLIDGPVYLDHHDLAVSRIREIPGRIRETCARIDSIACLHGTFVRVFYVLVAARSLRPFAPVARSWYDPFILKWIQPSAR